MTQHSLFWENKIMYHKMGSLKSWILEIQNKSLGILGSQIFKPPQSLEFWKYSSLSLVKPSSSYWSLPISAGVTSVEFMFQQIPASMLQNNAVLLKKKHMKRNIRDCFQANPFEDFICFELCRNSCFETFQLFRVSVSGLNFRIDRKVLASDMILDEPRSLIYHIPLLLPAKKGSRKK